MKRNSSVLLGLLGSALLLFSASHAQAQATAKPPTQLTYQGFLTDGNGSPFGNTTPVNKTVIFRIYDALTGGTLKWSSQQVVTVDKGYFSVLLGQGSAVGNEAFSADLTGIFAGSSTVSDRYLELTADGTTIAPRLRFLPAPYALLAKSATDLVDPVTGLASLTIAGGTATAASFSGSGANLTSLNGANLNAGSVADSKLATITTAGKVANSATTGASANTASAIVTRDASGNFTAGTITATTFTGNGTIPIGGIIMWSGGTVPTGWALCNGTTVSGVTTPNLADRFIVGSGSSYAVNSTGGSSTRSLGVGNLPSFSINYQDIYYSESSGSVTVPNNKGSGDSDSDNKGLDMTRTATFNGSASAFSIIPPYYALAFIMRVQ